MPVSFLSLSLASVKLFYSQRLGRFPDSDPSLKMIVFVAPLVVLIIAGFYISFYNEIISHNESYLM
jgi:hypothetical protein